MYRLLNDRVRKASGIKMVISTSKIKKIRLIRKNWILNGIRDLEIGSNPHSKGDIFSRFFFSLIETKTFKVIRDEAIRRNIIIIIIIIKIIYIKIN